MRKNKIICFEGIDHSFKETNSKRLAKELRYYFGYDKVKLISFPNYESKSSYFVTKYLNGSYGKLNELDPYLISVFYALDRYDTMISENINELLEKDCWIILDRYTGSNLCFQSAKYKDKKEREEYIKKTLNFEFNVLKLPKPDITIFLGSDNPINIVDNNKEQKHTGKDIHESNKEYLKLVNEVSKDIIKEFGWEKINITDNRGRFKSKDDIYYDISYLLQSKNIY